MGGEIPTLTFEERTKKEELRRELINKGLMERKKVVDEIMAWGQKEGI